MTKNMNRTLEFLEAAEAAQYQLRDEYETPSNYRDPAKIAALHQQIGFAFKAAEVHATLAIAQEIQRFTLRAYPFRADGTVAS